MDVYIYNNNDYVLFNDFKLNKSSECLKNYFLIQENKLEKKDLNKFFEFSKKTEFLEYDNLNKFNLFKNGVFLEKKLISFFNKYFFNKSFIKYSFSENRDFENKILNNNNTDNEFLNIDKNYKKTIYRKIKSKSYKNLIRSVYHSFFKFKKLNFNSCLVFEFGNDFDFSKNKDFFNEFNQDIVIRIKNLKNYFKAYIIFPDTLTKKNISLSKFYIKKINQELYFKNVFFDYKKYIDLLFKNIYLYKKEFPVFLHPYQVAFIPKNNKLIDFCKENSDFLKKRNIDSLVYENNKNYLNNLNDSKEKLIPFALLVDKRQKAIHKFELKIDGNYKNMSISYLSHFIKEKLDF